MCLIVKNRSGIPLVAKEDIMVHKYIKMLNLSEKLVLYTTLYMDKKVEFDKDGICILEVPEMCGYVTLSGLGNINCRFPHKTDHYTHPVACVIVEQGIHSYAVDSAVYHHPFRFSPQSIMKCVAIIPKGTRYFEGINGDMVSEKLIIFKDGMETYYKAPQIVQWTI